MSLPLDRMTVAEAREALGLVNPRYTPPPRRTDEEILRDAARQLEEQWAALRKRWGGHVDLLRPRDR
jgi:hypothetical protein